MSFSGKDWIWLEQDPKLIAGLALDLGLSPALARLLVNRGITDSRQARAFLNPAPDQLHSPALMLGISEAVERLIMALDRGEKIIVHGDYDADGISAAVILVQALAMLGGRAEYYLPSRFDEGYGLHAGALEQFRDEGAALVVTVDCGINAHREVHHASKIGLDLIVTDHHQPLGSLNGAVAVINPLQENCPYPFKALSGAGVAFKLAAALLEKSASLPPDCLLDLAALGTAADVVPLTGENRVLVSTGLDVLRSLQRVGFKALAAEVSLDRERINSRTLAYVLAPAVNAAGRMGEARPAADLLLEKDPQRARELASCLHRANSKRRLKEQEILEEAEEMARALPDSEQGIITLAAENWHQGVIGIVASRLVERFNRPVVLIALEEGGEGRGSARSIQGFNITEALADSAPLLERFGGHEQAAGFTIRAEKTGLLRDSLNCYARLNLDQKKLKSRLEIEADLDPAEIDSGLAAMIEELQPFGEGNPLPLFGSKNWQLQSWRLVGSDRSHLKLKVGKGGRTLEPIFFSGAFHESRLEEGRSVDLAFRLKNGIFRERQTLDVEIKDLRYSDTFSEGRLQLIDRRGCRDRLALVKAIIDHNGAMPAIFAATRARAEKINVLFTGPGRPVLITAASAGGKTTLPASVNSIILFDLPLSVEMLTPLLEQRDHLPGGEALAVHLLYSDEDKKLNRRLKDLSLPTEERLKKITAALEQAADSAADKGFPGPVAACLDIAPASSFWERAEKILAEIGLLEGGRLSLRRAAIIGAWPGCLESSPTYRAAMELRQNCEQFQDLLLAGSLEEIAASLQDPVRDREG